LRILLDWWPRIAAAGEDAMRMFGEEKAILKQSATPVSWCHLYELPFKEHLAITLCGFMLDERFLRIMQGIVESESQIGSMPDVIQQIDAYMDTLEAETSKEEAKELLPMLATMLGASISAYYSLLCILYHGLFLNELIDKVRTGDDKSLFKAVRIDPTVIGCKPVIARFTQATMQNDDDFKKDLINALNGKKSGREQANFQMMRLILEVLHEAGASRLSNKQLRQLFVEELRLYARDADPKNLRKWVDTYMKKNATT